MSSSLWHTPWWHINGVHSAVDCITVEQELSDQMKPSRKITCSVYNPFDQNDQN